MLKIFDKAQWQIDGGIPEELVVNHFNFWGLIQID